MGQRSKYQVDADSSLSNNLEHRLKQGIVINLDHSGSGNGEGGLLCASEVEDATSWMKAAVRMAAWRQPQPADACV